MIETQFENHFAVPVFAPAVATLCVPFFEYDLPDGDVSDDWRAVDRVPRRIRMCVGGFAAGVEFVSRFRRVRTVL